MDDGKVRGFDLPTPMPMVWLGTDEDRYAVTDWPTRTEAWWETWRRSPLTQAWGDTDWDFLLDTALLHARLWLGDSKVAAELRLRVAKFGATPEDRMRLREQIVVASTGPTPAPAPEAGSFAARRAAAMKEAAGGA